jgi:hypothetical protein
MRRNIFLLLSTLLLLAACKPCNDPMNPECENYCDDPANPDCFNYDPCLGKAPVSAVFEIREAFYLGYPEGWPKYDTDTVATGLVEFYALEEGAQYEWYLGSEIIRTRSFARSDFPPGSITVRLRVIKAPNTVCFPDDDGEDIQTRAFFQKPVCGTLLDGRYRGVNSDAPTDTFELFLKFCYSQYTPWDPSPVHGLTPIMGIKGLGQGCDTMRVGGSWSHRQLQIPEGGISTNGPCRCIQGFMALKPDNLDSLLFDYSWRSTCQVNVGITKHFRGIRIRS